MSIKSISRRGLTGLLLAAGALSAPAMAQTEASSASVQTELRNRIVTAESFTIQHEGTVRAISRNSIEVVDRSGTVYIVPIRQGEPTPPPTTDVIVVITWTRKPPSLTITVKW